MASFEYDPHAIERARSRRERCDDEAKKIASILTGSGAFDVLLRLRYSYNYWNFVFPVRSLSSETDENAARFIRRMAISLGNSRKFENGFSLKLGTNSGTRLRLYVHRLARP